MVRVGWKFIHHFAIGDAHDISAKVLSLGLHIVGPEASTMISEAALSIEMAAFIEDVMLTVHPHPTMGEAFMEAAANAIGQAIHIPNR